MSEARGCDRALRSWERGRAMPMQGAEMPAGFRPERAEPDHRGGRRHNRGDLAADQHGARDVVAMIDGSPTWQAAASQAGAAKPMR